MPKKQAILDSDFGETVASFGLTSALASVLALPEFSPGTAWRLSRYQPQEMILREGESTGCVYLICSGTALIEGTVRLRSGRQFQAGITELKPGAIFGELALFDRAPHSASVIAGSAASVAVIERTTLLDFLDTHRDLGYEVFKEILEQLAPRFRKTTSRVYRFLAWGLQAYHLD